MIGARTVTCTWLAGPAVVWEALYGIAPFLLAQIAVIPMMGMPLFSGSVKLVMGSLVGHLFYGGLVGGVYRAPPALATVTSSGSSQAAG